MKKLFIDFTKPKIQGIKKSEFKKGCFADDPDGILDTGIMFPVINKNNEIRKTVLVNIWGGTHISLTLGYDFSDAYDKRVSTCMGQILGDKLGEGILISKQYRGTASKQRILRNISKDQFINDFKIDTKYIQDKIILGVDKYFDTKLEAIGKFEQDEYDKLVESYASSYTYEIA